MNGWSSGSTAGVVVDDVKRMAQLSEDTDVRHLPPVMRMRLQELYELTRAPVGTAEDDSVLHSVSSVSSYHDNLQSRDGRAGSQRILPDIFRRFRGQLCLNAAVTVGGRIEVAGRRGLVAP